MHLRWLAVLAVIVALVSGGLYAYTNGLSASELDAVGVQIPDVDVPEVKIPSLESTALGLPELSGSGSGSGAGDCPDIGVRINSVSVGAGQTVADILVTNGGGRVVLEVYSDGVLAGSKVRRMDGEGKITVAAVGDRAVLRPLGCTQFSDSMVIE